MQHLKLMANDDIPVDVVIVHTSMFSQLQGVMEAHNKKTAGARSSNGKLWGMADVVTFGKHRGRTIEWLIINARDYVVWCQDNIQGFELDPRAEQWFRDSEVDEV